MRPGVYPAWWGDSGEEDNAASLRSKNKQSPKKRLRSADPVKGRFNKNIARYAEDDLDRRLREV